VGVSRQLEQTPQARRGANQRGARRSTAQEQALPGEVAELERGDVDHDAVLAALFRGAPVRRVHRGHATEIELPDEHQAHEVLLAVVLHREQGRRQLLPPEITVALRPRGALNPPEVNADPRAGRSALSGVNNSRRHYTWPGLGAARLPWQSAFGGGMIELFQITGSASFAARMALEEAGAEYRTIDIHPRRRDEPASFAEVNPLRRVPALREGDVRVYETGAVLLYLADRFPERELGPAVGDPARASLYRWILWLADTLHPAWWPLLRKAVDSAVREHGRERMDAHGAYLERELATGPWCLGPQFSVADLYLYMLVGWQHYADGYELGGAHVRDHYRRVGERPAVARTRALDDLDERQLRYHPKLRAGKPI
jgi:glutathione S-transferase